MSVNGSWVQTPYISVNLRAKTATNYTLKIIPPDLWMRFTAASTPMKFWFTGSPKKLKTTAFINTFMKSRKDSLLFGFDDSTHKVGRQISKNWRGSVLAEIKVPWTSEISSIDKLRTILKATYYPHDFIIFDYWFLLEFYFHFNCYQFLVLQLFHETLVNVMIAMIVIVWVIPW